MKELIEVYRMDEVSKETRANLIVKLGELINYHYAANVTEPVVFELVTLLHPNHPILADSDFKRRAGLRKEII